MIGRHVSSERSNSYGIGSAFVLLLAFIAGWVASVNELRYWWGGQTVKATVVGREDYEIRRRDRDGFERREQTEQRVRLTYSFHDDALGTDRRETADLSLEHYMLHADDQQIEVQFIPGSTGDSRIPYFLNRYFAVLFFLGNGLLAGLAFWGWRMLRADTWARKPGRRARK